jgi:hypothetical protein
MCRKLKPLAQGNRSVDAKHSMHKIPFCFLLPAPNPRAGWNATSSRAPCFAGGLCFQHRVFRTCGPRVPSSYAIAPGSREAGPQSLTLVERGVHTLTMLSGLFDKELRHGKLEIDDGAATFASHIVPRREPGHRLEAILAAIFTADNKISSF